MSRYIDHACGTKRFCFRHGGWTIATGLQRQQQDDGNAAEGWQGLSKSDAHVHALGPDPSGWVGNGFRASAGPLSGPVPNTPGETEPRTRGELALSTRWTHSCCRDQCGPAVPAVFAACVRPVCPDA
jgi:hypothetical protein